MIIETRTDITLEIRVKCSVCGRDLSAEFIDSPGTRGASLHVDPCENCLEEARKAALQSGT